MSLAAWHRMGFLECGWNPQGVSGVEPVEKEWMQGEATREWDTVHSELTEVQESSADHLVESERRGERY